MKDAKILLGVTGGIAAYKALDLASSLIKAGAKVRTIMTENSRKFVTPDAFRAITRDQVETCAFNLDEPIAHIDLADWADIMVIAPATANIIGKLASGIADDLLTTTALAMHTKKLIVPAMNVNMFANSIVQENLDKLKKHGWMVLEPESGRLACGYVGKGRFPATTEIVFAIQTYLKYGRDLESKRIMITAGACREHLDEMRFLTNHSSGKTGLALARAAYLRGAEVTLIHAHLDEPLPHYLEGIHAETAHEMLQACLEHFPNCDILFKAAAVTDYTFADPVSGKMKKSGDLILPMKRTQDILKALGEAKKPHQILVGFAAESDDVVDNARKKLQSKNLDFVCGNLIRVSGQLDSHLHVISKKDVTELTGSKFDLAHKLLDIITGAKR